MRVRICDSCKTINPKLRLRVRNGAKVSKFDLCVECWAKLHKVIEPIKGRKFEKFNKVKDVK